MPTIWINNRELTFSADERMNGIEAARRVHEKIPHYCWYPGLSVVGSCRMCLVEVGQRDPKTGKITMRPKLEPACNLTVTDNMVIVGDSERVARARAMVEEDLLLRHPIDCPICDKAGECKLQDYHFKYGQASRRAEIRPFTSRRRDLGDITLFVDRCVLCSRCVRFTREVSGAGELMISRRGTHEEIEVVPGFPLNNKLSGNVVDLCPVGALADKNFLYRQRVWFLSMHPGVCTGCSTGCSTTIEENHEHVYRITPRKNPFVNKWWICNDGRYDYPHIHDPRRIQSTVPTNVLRDSLRAAGRLAAVVSPHLTVEEAFLLCKMIRGVNPEALLVLGPIPREGEDEHFPGGFTIHAEKCPNRRGVEAILSHFAHRVLTFEELLPMLDGGAVQGVWVSGGYKADWIDSATAAKFERLKLLVVQDLFPSPLSERATHVLGGAAFAERDGSYVNFADRLQSVGWAIRPPQGVATDARVLWDLLGRRGLYNSQDVLDEVAREILYFSAAIGPVPETGIDLKSNMIA